MPSSESNRHQSRLTLSKGAGVVCLIIGLLLSLAWGFRLYILVLNAQVDRWLLLHSAVTAISLIMAVVLMIIGVGALNGRHRANDARWVAGAGAWIIAVGLNRLIAVTLWPASDPNPRAHLHLSVSFLVMGSMLVLVTAMAAWRRRRDNRYATTQGAVRHHSSAG
jgi:uncharacterized membrane protein YidH (DUF202 family)